MGNYLKVKLWADMPSNPDNIPGGRVAEVVPIQDGEPVVPPWRKLTREEFQSLNGRKSAERKELGAYIRARAYELETGGMTVGGVRIPTGRDDQAMLSGAVNYLALNPTVRIDWQGEDGTFTTLGKAQVEAIASAVGTHVQAHFTRRKQLLQALAQTADSELGNFRATITQFWEE